MTCVVALKQGDQVYLGADSLASDVSNGSATVRHDSKIFTNGGITIGYTSSYRMGQLLQYVWKPPPLPRTKTVEAITKYAVTKLVPSLIKLFKNNGLLTVNEEVISGGNFIMVIHGHVFEVEEDMTVSHPVLPYLAVGAGTDIALGALAATEGLDPHDRIVRALTAASVFNTTVRPPWKFITIGG